MQGGTEWWRGGDGSAIRAGELDKNQGNSRINEPLIMCLFLTYITENGFFFSSEEPLDPRFIPFFSSPLKQKKNLFNYLL